MTPTEAAAELDQVRGLFLRALDKTPDDRLTWSPSPSSRTPLQLAAHSAYSLGFIKTMLESHPYATPTMEQADAEFMEMDSGVETREQAVALLNQNAEALIAYLNSVQPSELDRMVMLPFGLGQAPLGNMLGVGSMHTRSHLAQLEYLQTIYGDRSW
jgi:hypothetical protein